MMLQVQVGRHTRWATDLTGQAENSTNSHTQAGRAERLIAKKVFGIELCVQLL